MSAFKTIKRVSLGAHHLRPGRSKHSIKDSHGQREFAPFVSLEIANFPGDSGYYLLHNSEKGEVADTWHASIAEAMHQAEFEFGVQENEWTDVTT